MTKNEKILKSIVSAGGAELTGRLIPGDADFEYPEWVETATLDGVPVSIYYRTTPEDLLSVDNSGGDWGAVDWTNRIDRIVIDDCECDRTDIDDMLIDRVKKEYKIAIN